MKESVSRPSVLLPWLTGASLLLVFYQPLFLILAFTPFALVVPEGAWPWLVAFIPLGPVVALLSLLLSLVPARRGHLIWVNLVIAIWYLVAWGPLGMDLCLFNCGAG